MIYNIQLLRGVAAFLVIFVHMDKLFEGFGIHADTGFGSTGVDLFFVISGFVMVHTTKEDRRSVGGFLLNRVIRIAPLYWLMTSVLVLMAIASPQLFDRGAPTVGHFLLSLLFVPFNNDGQTLPLLFVGWSLNMEMVFYVLFALGLLLPSRTGRTLVVASVITAYVAIANALGTRSTISAFYANPVMVEFALGMLVCLFADRWKALPSWFCACLVVAGATALIGGYFVLTGVPRLVWSGPGATAVLIGAYGLETHGRRAEAKAVQLFGAASYALYLTHVLTIRAIGKAVAALHPAPSPMVVASTVCVAAGASCVVALFVHLLVERPMTNWLRLRVGHQRSRVDIAEQRAVLPVRG